MLRWLCSPRLVIGFDFAMPTDGGRPLCCGRTFLSVGKVDEARREAERTLAALAPFVAAACR